MTAATALLPGRPGARPPGDQTLLLFDVDSTLITSGACRAHIAAVHAAMRSVYGVPDPAAARIQMAGMTDLSIARAILAAAGPPRAEFGSLSAAFCQEAARQHDDLCPADLTEFVIPGIPGLLGYLAGRRDVRLGLVTGGIREIVALKLERAGLARFFDLTASAFGSDAEDRAALPPLARARAGAPAEPHPARDTWVIGDTPHDIACAHADGVPCIAVTTGRYGAAQLAGAEHVAGDAGQLRAILDRELRVAPPAITTGSPGRPGPLAYQHRHRPRRPDAVSGLSPAHKRRAGRRAVRTGPAASR